MQIYYRTDCSILNPCPKHQPPNQVWKLTAWARPRNLDNDPEPRPGAWQPSAVPNPPSFPRSPEKPKQRQSHGPWPVEDGESAGFSPQKCSP